MVMIEKGGQHRLFLFLITKLTNQRTLFGSIAFADVSRNKKIAS